jgi:hypothetical protein
MTSHKLENLLAQAVSFEKRAKAAREEYDREYAKSCEYAACGIDFTQVKKK